MKEHPNVTHFFHHEDTKSAKRNKLRVLRVSAMAPALLYLLHPYKSFVANNKTGCRDYMLSKLLTVSDSPLRLKHFFLAEAGA